MAIKKRKHISKYIKVLVCFLLYVSKPMKYNWNKVDGEKYNNKNDTLPVFCFFVSVIILLGERNTVF